MQTLSRDRSHEGRSVLEAVEAVPVYTMSAKKRPTAKPIVTARHATAIAIVYDSICRCSCSCPEHQSDKIRSEIRFETLPEELNRFTKPGAFPLDRERRNGPMKADAVRARAETLALMLGLPLLDEALGKVPR